MHEINEWKSLVPLYTLKYDLLKKKHLFDKSNHQRSNLLIACKWYRHVEVLSTPLCLKDTNFEKNSSFYKVCMRSTSGRG